MSKFKVILRVCKDFGENTSILGKQKQISTNCTIVFNQTNKNLLSQDLEMLLKPRQRPGQSPGW